MACLIHKWNGCKCERCGKIRDEGHDIHPCWGTCKRCYKRLYKEKDHKYQYIGKGCKQICVLCGVFREHHDFEDSCVCRRCGEKSKYSRFHHYVTKRDICREVCSICGKEGDAIHDFKPNASSCDEICSVCGKVASEGQREKHHDFELLPDCSRKCRRCGYVLTIDHDLEIIPDCSRKCRRCGKVFTGYHEWQSLPGCRKKCLNCGVVYYNHNMYCAGTVGGYGDDCNERYECRNCNYSYDTWFDCPKEEGPVE